MGRILFLSADKKINLINRRKTKTLLHTIFKKEKKNLEEFRIIFCSNEFISNINKTFLNHDYPTDTLTFDLSNDLKFLNGEAYISVQTIKANAYAYKTIYQIELLRVIIHSALHLCGYNDKLAIDKIRMTKKENYYLTFHVKQSNNHK